MTIALASHKAGLLQRLNEKEKERAIEEGNEWKEKKDVWDFEVDISAFEKIDAAGGAGALVPALEADTAWTRIFHLLHRASTPTVAVVEGGAIDTTSGTMPVLKAWARKIVVALA